MNLSNDSQLYPGEQEESHYRCSKVKDKALLDVYDQDFKKIKQRNVDFYSASRRILPVKFKTYYDEKIKPKYAGITYNQFRSICPFNIHEVALNWKSYCICHFCTNWSYRKRFHKMITKVKSIGKFNLLNAFKNKMNSFKSIDILKRIGESVNLTLLAAINYDTLLNHHVCDSKNDSAIRNCLRRRKRKSCFAHSSSKSNCTNCLHTCSSGITDFIMDIVANANLSFNVKFPRLERFGTKLDRWLPLDHSKCDLMASDAVKLACERLEFSLGHKYDLETYSNNKITWSFKDNKFPPPGLVINYVDHGSPVSLNFSMMGQSQGCKLAQVLLHLYNISI